MGAVVPNITELSNDCTGTPGRSFGMVVPGSSKLTSTAPGACQISFRASANTATLRIAQADGIGTAMGRSTNTWAASQAPDSIYNDAVATSATTGYAVGAMGRIARTTNGGTSWTEWDEATTGTGGWWYRVAAEPGGTTIYTVGANRELLRITNPATATPTFTHLSASLSALPAGIDLLGIAAPAVGTVYVAGIHGSAVYVTKSTDSGASFSAPVQLPGMTRLSDVAAGSSSDIWVIGSGTQSGIMHNTTGGTTAGAWSELAAPDRYWYSIDMSSPSNGYISSAGGETWRWNGTTWGQVANPGVGTMRSLSTSAAAPDTVWAVGNDGDTGRSTDGGTTWTRIRASVATRLTGVSSFDGTHGILAGDDRWAGWTDDGASLVGERFEPDVTKRSMVSVAASPTDGQRLLAVGNGGVVRRSLDGGSTWTTPSSGTTRALWSVDMTSSLDAWAVGADGTILRSADGGATWTTVVSGTAERLLAIDAVDQYHAWAVGDAGTVLTTSDGGATWRAVAAGAGSTSLRTVSAWTKDTVVIAGTGASIRRTSNGGMSWSGTTSTPGTYDQIPAVRHASATTLYAITAYQDVWRSTDSGASWSATAQPPTGGEQRAFTVLDDDVLVVGGGYQNAVISLDGGSTWTSRTIGIDGAYGFTRVDEHTIVAVGRVGGTTATSVSVAPNESIADFGAAPADWSVGSTASMFATCVQALGGGATIAAAWGVGVDPDTCSISASDPWRSVPATSTAVATAATGTLGSVDFVWGARFASNQAPGRYSATIAFEVTSPAV